MHIVNFRPVTFSFMSPESSHGFTSPGSSHRFASHGSTPHGQHTCVDVDMCVAHMKGMKSISGDGPVRHDIDDSMSVHITRIKNVRLEQ